MDIHFAVPDQPPGNSVFTSYAIGKRQLSTPQYHRPGDGSVQQGLSHPLRTRLRAARYKPPNPIGCATFEAAR